MKIIRKETWISENTCSNDTIISYFNSSNEWITIKLGECSELSGDFYGFGKNRKIPTKSSIEFIPYGGGLNSSDLDLFPPDYDEEEYFKNPEIWDNYELKSIKIPKNTCVIQLQIAPGDTICINAKRKEDFVLVDDNGNEIPLENLLGGKQSASP